MEPPAEVAQQQPVTPPVAPRSYEHGVHFDLGLFVVGIGYERVVAPRIAFQISPHLYRAWLGEVFDRANLTGFGVTLRPTIFLTDDAPRGVYVSPFLRIDRVESDKDDAKAEWGYSTGAFVGYSWIRGEHFNVRLGAGLQWMAYETFAGSQREAFKSFFPAIDIVAGYMR